MALISFEPLDLAGAGLINLPQLRLIRYDPARGEIGSLDDRHQFLERKERVFHIGDHAVDDLAEIMGRDTRRHTDRDPFRAIDQDIRHPHRQDHRLFLRLVKVRHKVYRIFIYIGKHFH